MENSWYETYGVVRLGELNAQTTHFSFVGWGLDTIPAELWQCTQLKELFLRYNNLTALPSELTELRNHQFKNIGFTWMPEFKQQPNQMAFTKL